MAWRPSDVPDQSGRVAVITGANSGIGYEAARALAARGARVVLLVRNPERGETAAGAIREEVPAARLEVVPLQLRSLASVEAAAEAVAVLTDRVDVLVNNAGVMMPTTLQRTEDGFEEQFGVNHLGHFALTGRLLELLTAADAARVVTIGSVMHRQGRIVLDDLNWETRRYDAVRSYGQSKLANLLFAQDLDRRLVAAGLEARSFAAHPGMSGTRLFRHQSGINVLSKLLAQSPEKGAWPTLMATTSDRLKGGEYVGPRGLFEVRGRPKAKAWRSRRGRDMAMAARLWEHSEELTGVRYLSDALVA